jgi:hypothetical protein
MRVGWLEGVGVGGWWRSNGRWEQRGGVVGPAGAGNGVWRLEMPLEAGPTVRATVVVVIEVVCRWED